MINGFVVTLIREIQQVWPGNGKLTRLVNQIVGIYASAFIISFTPSNCEQPLNENTLLVAHYMLAVYADVKQYMHFSL